LPVHAHDSNGAGPMATQVPAPQPAAGRLESAAIRMGVTGAGSNWWKRFGGGNIMSNA
jgi:hypothetical protein